MERITPAQLDLRLKAATNSAPGVIFGAVWRDGAAIVRTAGKADLRTRRNVMPETPFAWFSVTKLFTATAVVQLSELGRLHPDAPVRTYLPDTRLSRGGREATVRELLSHTAGVPNPIPITWVHLAGERGPTLDGLIRRRLGER